MTASNTIFARHKTALRRLPLNLARPPALSSSLPTRSVDLPPYDALNEAASQWRTEMKQ